MMFKDGYKTKSLYPAPQSNGVLIVHCNILLPAKYKTLYIPIIRKPELKKTGKQISES